METRTEVMFGQLYDRRVDFLRDMDVRELMELFPSEEDKLIFKHFLIEKIIENLWDKQINEEVK